MRFLDALEELTREHERETLRKDIQEWIDFVLGRIEMEDDEYNGLERRIKGTTYREILDTAEDRDAAQLATLFYQANEIGGRFRL